MQHGKAEQAIIRQCVAERTPFPDFIKDAPELRQELLIFYNAFWELSGDRPTMGGPISWIATKEYASFCRYDEYQTDFLFVALRAMDQALSESRENGNT